MNARALGWVCVAALMAGSVAGAEDPPMVAATAPEAAAAAPEAAAGRQLFPFVQPVVRYSFLKPEFAGGSPRFPSPSEIGRAHV